ncbi:hypothetical protein Daus18300_005493 [Diaporthe australafricana]|uniref:MYND-type domain-containing protein n=1 Tax=Diaporthe australafricana TaxID=127596 RepID=A0ABR3X1T7_9PEZI
MIRIIEPDHKFLQREPTSNLLCTCCPAPGALKCSGCHLARYCSPGCQRKDRATHAAFCKSFDDFTANKRPSPLHIRAILFPENKKAPEWTWVLMRDDRAAIALTHLYKGLPTDGLTHVTFAEHLSTRCRRVPQNWLTSLSRCQLTKGEHASSLNQSVLSLGNPAHVGTYRGPLLVVANKPDLTTKDDRGIVALMEDVEMEDVAHVMDGLAYGSEHVPCVVNLPRYPRKTLPALKVNCMGDRWRFYRDALNWSRNDAAVYTHVTVPNVKWAWEDHQWPALGAFTVGLPWVYRRATTNKDFWHCAKPFGTTKPDETLLANDELGCLTWWNIRKEADLPKRLQGPIDPFVFLVEPNPGTALLFNIYGVPIRREHVKALHGYDIKQGLDLPSGWRYRSFCRDGFKGYWDEIKNENSMPDADLSDVPSPYAWEDKHREEHWCVEGWADYEILLERIVALVAQAENKHEDSVAGAS